MSQECDHEEESRSIHNTYIDKQQQNLATLKEIPTPNQEDQKRRKSLVTAGQVFSIIMDTTLDLYMRPR